jgi:nucleoid-associated protein YgaU
VKRWKKWSFVMTSDAKIGLLLGLVFIFIIAFIINGLPRFHRDKDNNELTNKMVSQQNNPPGLGAKERKAQESLTLTESAKDQTVGEGPLASSDKGDIRSIAPLPAGDFIVRDILAGKTTDILPSQSTEQVKPSVIGPIADEKADVKKPDAIKPVWPKTYVVSEGDNLAEIAKKLYGEQEGNKRTSVTRIFEANKNLLKSPDEIYIGQKLTIPAPLTVSADNSKTTGIFSPGMFEKVKSIGQKHLLTESTSTKQGGQYVVKEGDSLWRIATEQLGASSRYKEISKLNADVLKDEDNLVVGMRLKLPAR